MDFYSILAVVIAILSGFTAVVVFAKKLVKVKTEVVDLLEKEKKEIGDVIDKSVDALTIVEKSFAEDSEGGKAITAGEVQKAITAFKLVGKEFKDVITVGKKEGKDVVDAVKELFKKKEK